MGILIQGIIRINGIKRLLQYLVSLAQGRSSTTIVGIGTTTHLYKEISLA
jgi:hypothetical protein